MSPASFTSEQFERWHKRTCVRCGRFGCFAAVWPDGSVCRTCECRALRLNGQCPGCGEHRILPGLRPVDGAAICTQCADFRPSYACARCGEEGQLRARRLCTRCTFSDQLAALLDDGAGRVRPELVPMHEMLAATGNPRSGLSWLDGRPPNPKAAAILLRGLGSGEIPLTHEAFHQLQPWRAAEHLRDLAMSCGLLPVVDKQICLFERWLAEHLAGIAGQEHRQIVRRFAIWHVLPKLRSRAERKPLTPASRGFAGDQVRRTTAFLSWLAARELGLADCRQAEIDAWHSEHSQHERTAVRAFLLWCAASKLTRQFTLPTTRVQQTALLTRARRIELLGMALTDVDAMLRSRIAAGLLLLYAQPVSRIVRLTLDDIVADGEHVLIQLGNPPSPVPEPFAALLLDYAARRSTMKTAAIPGSNWLFPGRNANQPLRPEYLAKLVHQLGVPTVAGRTAAFRQHVIDMPAPVVADALNYHQITAARAAIRAGTTWSRYAPGDHTPSSPRPNSR